MSGRVLGPRKGGCHLVRGVCSVRYNADRMSQNRGHHAIPRQQLAQERDLLEKLFLGMGVGYDTFVERRLQTLLTIYGKVSYLHQGDLAGWLLYQFLT